MSYNNPRIGLMDSGMDVVLKMGEGNPGAISVLLDMMAKNQKIDPDNAFGPLGAVLSLDIHDIYGPKIWVLYKYVCNSNLTSMLGFLRAVQMGVCAESELQSAINAEKIDKSCLDEIIKQLKERLPNFAKSEATIPEAA